MKTGNLIKITLLIFMLLGLLLVVGCYGQFVNPTFNKLGISMKGFDNFVFDSQNNRIAAHDNTTILLILPLTTLNEEQARKVVGDKSAILEGQYETRDASYLGEVTREISCPAEFKPVKNPVKSRFSMLNYQIYSTKSLTYGVCAKDLIAYRAFLGFFYCAGKGMFQIEVFVPAGDEIKFKEMLDRVSTFSC